MEKKIFDKKLYETKEEGDFTIIRAKKGNYKEVVLTSKFKKYYELKEVKNSERPADDKNKGKK